jgi:hypothetical protein
MEQKDIKAIQLSLQEVLKCLKTLTQQVARMSDAYTQIKRSNGGR